MFAYLMQLALLFGGIILVGVVLTWLHDLVEVRLERVWTKRRVPSGREHRTQPPASQPSPMTPILVIPYERAVSTQSTRVQVRPQRRAA